MRKDTIQGLTVAIEAILQGLNRRHQLQRQNQADARAEEDQQLQRDYYARTEKRQAAADARAEEDQSMARTRFNERNQRVEAKAADPLERLNKAFDAISADSESRALAMKAVTESGGDIEAATKMIEQMQAGLEAPSEFIAPTFGSPGFDINTNYELMQKAHSEKQKGLAKQKKTLDEAYSSLKAYGLGGAMPVMSSQSAPSGEPGALTQPDEFDARFMDAVKNLQSVAEAFQTGDQLRIKAAQKNINSYIKNNGQHPDMNNFDQIGEALKRNGQQFQQSQKR